MKSPPPLPSPPPRANRTARWLFLAAAALFAVLMLSPAKSLFAKPCAFRNLTGLPCAYCGGTRAVHAALEGNWRYALYLNPVAVATAVAAAAIVAVILCEAITGRAVFAVLLARVPLKIRVTAAAGFFVLLIPWTAYHAWDALVTPKPEISNPRNPVAKFLKDRLTK